MEQDNNYFNEDEKELLLYIFNIAMHNWHLWPDSRKEALSRLISKALKRGKE